VIQRDGKSPVSMFPLRLAVPNADVNLHNSKALGSSNPTQARTVNSVCRSSPKLA